MKALLPWLMLAALGGYHGINPAMGWLFAVSRGLQERSARAVAWALPPIAAGHALSVAATLVLLGLGNEIWSTRHLRVAMALLLLAFGVWKLLRPRHPRWVGMRLGARDLTLWSFVMATAHGAGLMLLPVFLLAGGSAECGACARHSGISLNSWPGYLSAVSLHTAAMLFVAAVVAGLVYVKWGLGLLRTAWFNLDLLWSIALLGSGAAALFG